MIESEWNLQSEDGMHIYGVTNQATEKASERVIVMVHGIGCSRDSHPFPMAASHFLQNGYDVIRYDCSSGNEKARDILDSSADLYAQDLNSLLRKKVYLEYSQIFLVGHSYGGMVIMIANPEHVAAVSLWDPSFNYGDRKVIQDMGIEEDYGDRIALRGGSAVIMFSKKMTEADSPYVTQKCRELSQTASFPVQIIHAGQGILYKYGESYHSYCPHETDYHLIENAGHCFEQLDSLPLLLNKCTDWFNKF